MCRSDSFAVEPYAVEDKPPETSLAPWQKAELCLRVGQALEPLKHSPLRPHQDGSRLLGNEGTAIEHDPCVLFAAPLERVHVDHWVLLNQGVHRSFHLSA
ncbi:hypothetical protein D3C81_879900 [compost metagenome]